MPARFLLIDGYNLLYAAGMAQVNYAKGDLQRCRGRLLRFLLSKLTKAEVARATVVFDARDPPKDLPSYFKVSGLSVVFANPGGDADVAIENLIEDHSAPKSLTLISSDRRLQAAARRRRAQSIPSEQFYEDLERRERRAAEVALSDPKATGGLSEAQVQYWLKFFGEIPDADKLRRSPEKTRPPRKKNGDKPSAELDRLLFELEEEGFKA